jgi:hypothetical protein
LARGRSVRHDNTPMIAERTTDFTLISPPLTVERLSIDGG